MAKWDMGCPWCNAKEGAMHAATCKPPTFGATPIFMGSSTICPSCNFIGAHSEGCPIGTSTEGRKDDGGKARHDLIPPELPEAIAAVLAFGAGKYGERNWEKGMTWGRPFAAMMRHLWAWWRGEKADPETGFSHLWHAGCCIAFLIAFEQRNAGVDDRPR